MSRLHVLFKASGGSGNSNNSKLEKNPEKCYNLMDRKHAYCLKCRVKWAKTLHKISKNGGILNVENTV